MRLAIRSLWGKGNRGWLFPATLASSFTWLVYGAIYPPESFYIAELESLANVKIPSEAKFIYKNATFPDVHGDYSACFIVQLPKNAWTNLEASLSSLPLHESKYNSCGTLDEKKEKAGVKATRYTLTQRANRENIEVFIDYIPNENIAVAQWYQW